MQRTTIRLSTEQAQRLAHHSQRTRINQSEIIRTALDAYLNWLDEDEATRAPYRVSGQDEQSNR